MRVASRESVKVADEVWVATALLHREQSDRDDFTIDEIVERTRQEGMTEKIRAGVRVHATQHCVANRPPNPGRYRMLFATGKSTRRLFRPGDPYDPEREGSKTTPISEEIPEQYRTLLNWYRTEYVMKTTESPGRDPILALHELGRELWRSEEPDEYVRRLREGWE
jgi:hypothetical protein